MRDRLERWLAIVIYWPLYVAGLCIMACVALMDLAVLPIKVWHSAHVRALKAMGREKAVFKADSMLLFEVVTCLLVGTLVLAFL